MVENNTAQGDRLVRIMSNIFRLAPDRLTDDLDMRDTAAWDSLSHIELIAAIEDEFGIELSLDDIVRMTNVRTIKSVVAKKAARP